MFALLLPFSITIITTIFLVMAARPRRLNAAQATASKLIRPFIEMLANVPTISHQPSVARAMLSGGVHPVLLKPESQKSRKRGRCHACPRKKDIKVENQCTECEQFVCQQHAEKKLICKRCRPTIEDVLEDSQ